MALYFVSGVTVNFFVNGTTEHHFEILVERSLITKEKHYIELRDGVAEKLGVELNRIQIRHLNCIFST